jgi:hypothetical protein
MLLELMGSIRALGYDLNLLCPGFIHNRPHELLTGTLPAQIF